MLIPKMRPCAFRPHVITELVGSRAAALAAYVPWSTIDECGDEWRALATSAFMQPQAVGE